MTKRTALAEWSLLDLVEELASRESIEGLFATHEELVTELRTRLTILNNELDLPGAAMDREPIRDLVMGDQGCTGRLVDASHASEVV